MSFQLADTMNYRRSLKWTIICTAWIIFMYFTGKIQSSNEQENTQYRKIAEESTQRSAARQIKPQNLESRTKKTNWTTTTTKPYDDKVVAETFKNRLENLRQECKRDHYIRMQ